MGNAKSIERFTVASLLLTVPALGACGTGEPGPPIATGKNPALILQVDCGENGVANLDVHYAENDAPEGVSGGGQYLIGDTPYGDMEMFDRDYSTAPGFKEGTLTVETSPTRGTCLTRITNRESGDVLAERETAGTARLEALVPAMD